MITDGTRVFGYIRKLLKTGQCKGKRAGEDQTTLQIANTLNEIQFVTNIKLLHVSAPGCNPQAKKIKNYKSNTPVN